MTERDECSRCGRLFEADELTPIIGAYGLFAVFCKDCFEKEQSERVKPEGGGASEWPRRTS